jgi:hypothetical protein
MSYLYGEPRRSAFDSFAGGEASLGDIWSASREAMLYVENANSAHVALERAFDDRIEEVRQLTGRTLQNPLRAAEQARREGMSTFRRPSLDEIGRGDASGETAYRGDADSRIRAFHAELDTIAGQIPDQSAGQRLTRSVEGEAARRARETDARLGTFLSSRSGLGKWAALLGGGMAGFINDPINVASLVVGGGPGAGRTVAGRILAVATREAFVNGAAEAAIQPMVQDWRARAGLDAGLEEAMRNVTFAATLGGIFGAGIGAVGEAATRLRGPQVDLAAEIAAAEAHVAPAMRQALSGDIEAARTVLPEIRAALPPEARGALDHADALAHLDRTRPSAAPAARHDELVSQAHRALDMADDWRGFDADPEQIERVTRVIVGEEPARAPTAPAARSLSGFLIDEGGVTDFKGELAAIGADQVTERFRGRLVRQDGAPLDTARERAAQAGYFDHLYGTPDEAAARSTVRDLLDLIEEDVRGNPVLPGTAVRETGSDFEAARAGVEGLVSDIVRLGGPALDDDVLTRIARLSLDEGIEPVEAFDRVISEIEAADVPARPEGVRRVNDLPPGWSEAELLAASERRALTADADGIDDMAVARPDDEISPADLEAFGHLEIADEAGNVVPLSRYVADAARDDELATIIKACRA